MLTPSNENTPPAEPDDAALIGSDDFGPDFGLSAWISEGGEDREGVDLSVHVLANPDPDKPASHALLYGVAIMILDQTGVIARTIEEYLRDGPVTETAAVRAINLLIQQDANDQPA